MLPCCHYWRAVARNEPIAREPAPKRKGVFVQSRFNATWLLSGDHSAVPRSTQSLASVQTSCEPSTSNAQSQTPSLPITRRPSDEIIRSTELLCGAFTAIVAVTVTTLVVGGSGTSLLTFNDELPWTAVVHAVTNTVQRDRTTS